MISPSSFGSCCILAWRIKPDPPVPISDGVSTWKSPLNPVPGLAIVTLVTDPPVTVISNLNPDPPEPPVTGMLPNTLLPLSSAANPVPPLIIKT